MTVFFFSSTLTLRVARLVAEDGSFVFLLMDGGRVSPWKRAGSSPGSSSGENLYLFLSSKLTSSLHHTKGRGQRSHHNTQSAAEAARRHRGPIQRLYGPSSRTTKGCARCSTHQVACWPSCLAKLHFPHSHSSSCRQGTATQQQQPCTHPARRLLHVW